MESAPLFTPEISLQSRIIRTTATAFIYDNITLTVIINKDNLENI